MNCIRIRIKPIFLQDISWNLSSFLIVENRIEWAERNLIYILRHINLSITHVSHGYKYFSLPHIICIVAVYLYFCQKYIEYINKYCIMVTSNNLYAVTSVSNCDSHLLLQQEENNNVQSDCEGSISELPDGTHTIHKSAQSMLEMRKYTMAAANPILAEKLSMPSDASLQPLTTSTRLQVTPLTPKIEKGRFLDLKLICMKLDNFI